MKKNIIALIVALFCAFVVSIMTYAVPNAATVCDTVTCSDAYFETAPTDTEFCEEAEASNFVSFIPGCSEELDLFEEGVSIYDCLAAGMRNMESKIDISGFGITKSNVSTLSNYYGNALWMNPDLYYVSSQFIYWYNDKGIITSVSPKYLVTDTAEIAAVQHDINIALDEIVSYTDSSMDDIEKLLTVYDRIIMMSHYDYTFEKRTAKDLLLDGETVCQGYASVFYAASTRLGIPCGFVFSEEMNHVWNAVCIDDTWYHVDLTWDDTSYENSLRVTHEYFLKSNSWMISEGKHSGFTPLEDNCEKYDDYFWNNAISQIIIFDHKMYYVDSTDTYGSVCCFDTIIEDVYAVYNFNSLWPTPYVANYYLGAYSGLALYNNRLYFNTWNEILSCDLNGSDVVSEFTFEDTAEHSLYGCSIEGNKLYYVVGEKGHRYTVKEKNFVILPEIKEPNISVKSITFDLESIKIFIGKTEALTFKITPDNATNKEVMWSSSNETVAVVENGLVIATGPGSCTITATTYDGHFTDTIEVCVAEHIPGELNGDSVIDAADAILLLQHSMFPLLYPINYSGNIDFTKDDIVDMNDAILLLQYSMFPELYPIY